MRGSNQLIGLLNFLTFLLSIPILGGGIWLSSRANNTDCLKFLQWPIIFIGAAVMLVSFAGFAGSCYRNTFLMRLYLFSMFIVISLLIGFVVFAYAVTDKGSGRVVPNRVYLDYYLQDYEGTWLEERVASDTYWGKISSCLRDSKVCAKIGRMSSEVVVGAGGAPETADEFFQRKLSPIQSGCCKPPTECGYTYQSETVWNEGGGLVGPNPDCTRWSNNQQMLCYGCDSCKAGVLGSLKKSWRKVSVINIVVMILLVIIYVVAYAAYRNNRKMDNNEAYGEARMTKSHPTRIHL